MDPYRSRNADLKWLVVPHRRGCRSIQDEVDVMMHKVEFRPYLEPTDSWRQTLEEWCKVNLDKNSWISGYLPVDDDNNHHGFYYAFFRKQDEMMFRMVWC
jgi:hypothetical protein